MRQETACSKKKIFWKIFLLFIAVLAIGIVLVWWWLWQSLSRYEAGTPEVAVVNFLQQVQSGEEEAILQASTFSLQPYETKDDYLEVVRKNLEGLPADRDALRLSLQEESDGIRLYRVYAPDNHYATMRMKQQGDEWQIEPVVETVEPWTIQAPSHVQILINGQAAELQGESQPTTAAGFAGLPQELMPMFSTYTVSGLIKEPVITAQLPDGTACTVSLDEQARVATITSPASQALQEEIDAPLRQVADQYAKYVSRDAKKADLLALVYPGTQMEDDIQHIENQWYAKHDAVSLQNIEISDYESFAANAVSATVQFDFVVERSGWKDRVFPSSYRISLVKTEDGWLACGLAVQ